MKAALGLIEAIGLTAAVAALDAASKAADVKLVGYEKVIGVDKAVSVTIQIAGEVAAVKAGVEAGVAAANKAGRIVSSHVIPRPHEEVDMLLDIFEKNLKDKRAKAEEVEEKPLAKGKKQEINKENK